MGASDSKYKRIQLQPNLISDSSINDKAPKLMSDDFPYMDGRLREIDWKRVTQSGVVDWTDPYFKAGRDVILDPMIVRDKRILNWENFVWKRPAEIYGSGNYRIFNDINPDDI